MKIAAHIANERGRHTVRLSTQGQAHEIAIPTRASGFGSRANGGELLCLALATCYCNDLYREAEQRGIDVAGVDVRAEAEFGGPGEPAARIGYRVTVRARAAEPAIRDLIVHTDSVAEVQNTLRRGIDVRLEAYEAVAL